MESGVEKISVGIGEESGKSVVTLLLTSLSRSDSFYGTLSVKGARYLADALNLAADAIDPQG